MGNVGKHALITPPRHRHRQALLPVRRGRRGGRRVIPLLAVLGLALTASAAVSTSTYASQPTAPITIYPAGATPAGTEAGDHRAVQLGVRFAVSAPGAITAVRFYKAAINTGTHTATLWTGDGQRMSGGTARSESDSGWQTIRLARHVHVVPGRYYVASYYAPNGRYSQTQAEFARGRTVGNSMITASAGLYRYGAAGHPSLSWNATGYGVDVEFVPGDPGTTKPVPDPSTSTSGTPTTAPTSSTPSTPAPTTSATTTKPAPSSSTTTKPAPTSSTPAPDPTTTSAPPSSGYPTATNTGVPDDVTLRDVPGDVTSGPGWYWDKRGWVVVNTAGAVFSGFRVAGSVWVMAPNAVISNNDISDYGEGSGIGLRLPSRDVTVKHNTVHGPCRVCTNRLTYGINGDLGGDLGAKVIGNKLYWIDHPIQMERGLIQDNYSDRVASSGTDHVDIFFSGGGTTDQLTIRHNTFLNDYTGDGTTATIMLNNAFGVQSNRLIEDNLLGGGGYVIYGGGDTPGLAGTNVIVRNNVITTRYFPRGGYYGPIAHIQTGGSNVFSNNRWYDGPHAGELIEP